MSFEKPVKCRMPRYRAWQIRWGAECARCGRQAHHSHHESVTGQKGTATRPPDTETLGLCYECHDMRDDKEMEDFYPQDPKVLMLKQLNRYLHERKVR